MAHELPMNVEQGAVGKCLQEADLQTEREAGGWGIGGQILVGSGRPHGMGPGVEVRVSLGAMALLVPLSPEMVLSVDIVGQSDVCTGLSLVRG